MLSTLLAQAVYLLLCNGSLENASIQLCFLSAVLVVFVVKKHYILKVLNVSLVLVRVWVGYVINPCAIVQT